MNILDWLVCDDIRFEINGKKTLVGVYDQTIGFNIPENSSKPPSLRLSSLIRVLRINEDLQPDKVLVEFLQENEINAPISLNLDPEWKRLLTFVIRADFIFPKPCKLSLRLKFLKDDEVVRELDAPISLEVRFSENSSKN